MSLAFPLCFYYSIFSYKMQEKSGSCANRNRTEHGANRVYPKIQYAFKHSYCNIFGAVFQV